MPFDPKLIRPDEPPLMPNGELDLPSDLKALAEQLGDDAAHLAATYPPRQVIAQPLTAVARGGPRAIVVGAAGAVALASLLIGVAGVWIGTAGFRTDGTNEIDVAKVERATTDHQRSPAANSHPSQGIPATISTFSLTELSSPEMEALLDLIEREPNEVGSVSF